MSQVSRSWLRLPFLPREDGSFETYLEVRSLSDGKRRMLVPFAKEGDFLPVGSSVGRDGTGRLTMFRRYATEIELWPVPAGQSSPDQALAFDGKDDYVEIPSLKLDTFPETQPLTIEARVTLQTGATCNVVSWLGKTWMALYHAGGEWGAGRLTAKGSHMRRAPGTARRDASVHLAAVWTGTTYKLFLDGKPLTVQPGDFRLSPTSGGLFIGGVPFAKLTGHTQARWFGGIVDEVRISKPPVIRNRSRLRSDSRPMPTPWRCITSMKPAEAPCATRPETGTTGRSSGRGVSLATANRSDARHRLPSLPTTVGSTCCR